MNLFGKDWLTIAKKHPLIYGWLLDDTDITKLYGIAERAKDERVKEKMKQSLRDLEEQKTDVENNKGLLDETLNDIQDIEKGIVSENQPFDYTLTSDEDSDSMDLSSNNEHSDDSDEKADTIDDKLLNETDTPLGDNIKVAQETDVSDITETLNNLSLETKTPPTPPPEAMPDTNIKQDSPPTPQPEVLQDTNIKEDSPPVEITQPTPLELLKSEIDNVLTYLEEPNAPKEMKIKKVYALEQTLYDNYENATLEGKKLIEDTIDSIGRLKPKIKNIQSLDKLVEESIAMIISDEPVPKKIENLNDITATLTEHIQNNKLTIKDTKGAINTLKHLNEQKKQLIEEQFKNETLTKSKYNEILAQQKAAKKKKHQPKPVHKLVAKEQQNIATANPKNSLKVSYDTFTPEDHQIFLQMKKTGKLSDNKRKALQSVYNEDIQTVSEMKHIQEMFKDHPDIVEKIHTMFEKNNKVLADSKVIRNAMNNYLVGDLKNSPHRLVEIFEGKGLTKENAIAVYEQESGKKYTETLAQEYDPQNEENIEDLDVIIGDMLPKLVPNDDVRQKEKNKVKTFQVFLGDAKKTKVANDFTDSVLADMKITGINFPQSGLYEIFNHRTNKMELVNIKLRNTASKTSLKEQLAKKAMIPKDTAAMNKLLKNAGQKPIIDEFTMWKQKAKPQTKLEQLKHHIQDNLPETDSAALMEEYLTAEKERKAQERKAKQKNELAQKFAKFKGSLAGAMGLLNLK